MQPTDDKQDPGEPVSSQTSYERTSTDTAKHSERLHSGRTLAADAPFIIPYLRSRTYASRLRVRVWVRAGVNYMQWTTWAFAQIVAPDQVIGIDISKVQLDRARTLSDWRGIADVPFEAGGYLRNSPTLTNRSMSHSRLSHLRDPLRALREMRWEFEFNSVAVMRIAQPQRTDAPHDEIKPRA